MILYALTMTNDISTDGLSRMFSSHWGQDGVQKTAGQSDGLLLLANNVEETLYLEPTVQASPNRYLVSTVRLRNMSITSPAPTLSVFGMRFTDGKDPEGREVGFRTLDLCIVHDTTTGQGTGYVNGRYMGEFTASRKIEVLDDSPSESISFRLSNLAIYSMEEPSLVKPFVPTLLPLGSNQTGWNVPNSLDADLGKQDPTQTAPAVTTSIDGAKISVPSTGKVLIEAAGSLGTASRSRIKVNSIDLGLTSEQAPSPILLVDTTGLLEITRDPE